MVATVSNVRDGRGVSAARSQLDFALKNNLPMSVFQTMKPGSAVSSRLQEIEYVSAWPSGSLKSLSEIFSDDNPPGTALTHSYGVPVNTGGLFMYRQWLLFSWPWMATFRALVLLDQAPVLVLVRKSRLFAMLQPAALPESSLFELVGLIRRLFDPLPLTSTTTKYVVSGSRTMPAAAVNVLSWNEVDTLRVGFVNVPSLTPGRPDEFAAWIVTL